MAGGAKLTVRDGNLPVPSAAFPAFCRDAAPMARTLEACPNGTLAATVAPLDAARLASPSRSALVYALASPLVTGCDTPSTSVVFDNGYPQDAARPLVVYDALWVATSLPAPVLPGASPGPVAPCRPRPTRPMPSSRQVRDPGERLPAGVSVAVQSRAGFAVDLNGTLHVHIDATAFDGDCAARASSPKQ